MPICRAAPPLLSPLVTSIRHEGRYVTGGNNTYHTSCQRLPRHFVIFAFLFYFLLSDAFAPRTRRSRAKRATLTTRRATPRRHAVATAAFRACRLPSRLSALSSPLYFSLPDVAIIDFDFLMPRDSLLLRQLMPRCRRRADAARRAADDSCRCHIMPPRLRQTLAAPYALADAARQRMRGLY